MKTPTCVRALLALIAGVMAAAGAVACSGGSESGAGSGDGSGGSAGANGAASGGSGGRIAGGEAGAEAGGVPSSSGGTRSSAAGASANGGRAGAGSGGRTEGGAPGKAGTTGSAAEGGEGGGNEITEDDLARCDEGDACAVVPYSHCCGATKRAVNADLVDEYEAHPEWQVFEDPGCATIGPCRDDSRVTTASCITDAAVGAEGYCQLEFPQDCEPVTCLLLCPDGFAVGPDGCEICECAPKPAELCALDFDAGPCEATVAVYTYEAASRRCVPAVYGGCGGNDNRFATEAECYAACPVCTGDDDCAGLCGMCAGEDDCSPLLCLGGSCRMSCSECSADDECNDCGSCGADGVCVPFQCLVDPTTDATQRCTLQCPGNATP